MLSSSVDGFAQTRAAMCVVKNNQNMHFQPTSKDWTVEETIMLHLFFVKKASTKHEN
jgi:hypothetical protein